MGRLEENCVSLIFIVTFHAFCLSLFYIISWWQAVNHIRVVALFVWFCTQALLLYFIKQNGNSADLSLPCKMRWYSICCPRTYLFIVYGDPGKFNSIFLRYAASHNNETCLACLCAPYHRIPCIQAPWCRLVHTLWLLDLKKSYESNCHKIKIILHCFP